MVHRWAPESVSSPLSTEPSCKGHALATLVAIIKTDKCSEPRAGELCQGHCPRGSDKHRALLSCLIPNTK